MPFLFDDSLDISNPDGFLFEDLLLKGGYSVVDDLTARDALPPSRLKEGKLVMTKSDKKIWIIDKLDIIYDEFGEEVAKPVWSEFKIAGSADNIDLSIYQRKSQTLPFVSVPTNATRTVQINNMGKTALLYDLRTSVPSKVEIFGMPDYSDDNPYSFVSTPELLHDDGSTVMSDGSRLWGRKYSILSNLEVPPRAALFLRVTQTQPGWYDNFRGWQYPQIDVTMTYLSLEA